MNFKLLNVLVCGMARSGIAAAKLLVEQGANVTIQDLKLAEKIKIDTTKLEQMGIKLFLGRNPDDILKEFNLIILSPGIPCDLTFIRKAKGLGIEIWGEVELAYKFCSSNITAITGTNGKSTTTALVGELFRTQKDTYVLGNIGVPFSDKVLQMHEDCLIALEISSFQLESCVKFKPKIAVVLNVTPDHLNRHKTMENYIAIKEKVFENQDKHDFTILNYDNDITRNMAKNTKAKVIFFSINELDEGVFVNKQGDVCVKLFGINEVITNINKINVILENVLASIAIAICENIEIDNIKTVVENFKGLEHRIELVSNKNDIIVYNDSKATNPESSIKAIDTIKRPIILIGGGKDKNSDYSEWIKSFENKVKHFIVLGEVSDKIIETCKVYSFFNYDKVNSLKDGVEFAYSKAKKGDCILFSPACSSYDMFDNFEQRGRVFKQFVMEVIESYDK